MTKLLRLTLVWLMLGSGLSQADGTPPTRVVSINLCTDQLLLMLADPGQIASISYLAQDPESSFLADQAIAYPLNHASLEELIGLKPDLVLAGPYTDPRLLRQLKRFSLQVEQFPLTSSIRGVQKDIRRMASLLGRPKQGEKLIESMQTKIAHTQTGAAQRPPPKALFYQPRGYTSGTNTLQNAALEVAGWGNIAAEIGIAGYAPIDLETLLLAQPQQIFTSSHSAETESRAQQQLDHPALRKILKHRPIHEIPFKYWICAGPMIAEAINLLNAAHGH